jgi:hypothetical protein
MGRKRRRGGGGEGGGGRRRRGGKVGARQPSAVQRECERGTQVGGEMAAMAAGPSSVGYGRSELHGLLIDNRTL